ncbi:Rieske domain-containing protein [Hyaloscypha hepaticicola]|uniref:Rieske domain-containing protein n=1 Tax=Hyaloscypha hepaticicola TaxID=2082293 RepID=A0A2J6PMT5_9HELO|nr:Rieske domain-containing protein [Hyaloscypha hepaticicola]
MTAPFVPPSRTASAWFFAGLTSSFPDIASQDGKLSDYRSCSQELTQGCKAFSVSRSDCSHAVEVELQDPAANVDLKDQVLVFQHRGKFHAIDHRCPHSSFPLSEGRVFDIEDFGIVLSIGITCSKHDWSFDLHSGQADRGTYKLGIWEVQLRPLTDSQRTELEDETPEVKGIWVRRKQRIG